MKKAVKDEFKAMGLSPASHVERALDSIAKPQVKRLNVEVSKETHDILKSIAARNGQKIKEVIDQLIENYIRSNEGMIK